MPFRLIFIETLPPFALNAEPEDCIRAILKYLDSLLSRSLDTVQLAKVFLRLYMTLTLKIVETLVACVISRAEPQYLLYLVNTLLVNKNIVSNLDVSAYVQHMVQFNSDLDLSVLLQKALRCKHFFILALTFSSEFRI